LVEIADSGVELPVALLVLSAFRSMTDAAAVGFVWRGEGAMSVQEHACIHEAAVSGLPSHRRTHIYRIKLIYGRNDPHLALNVLMNNTLHVI
jgi:hypothetical protein